MHNIPSLKPKELITILLQKGFVLDRIKGSHHIFYHPETKKRAVVPYHCKEIPVGTLLEILYQAGIPKDELKQ
jgi:predicted RNA binding protein YcfA (HicA-like mRNA interferase family)